jgi:hypothetical protein
VGSVCLRSPAFVSLEMHSLYTLLAIMQKMTLKIFDDAQTTHCSYFVFTVLV